MVSQKDTAPKRFRVNNGALRAITIGLIIVVVGLAAAGVIDRAVWRRIVTEPLYTVIASSIWMLGSYVLAKTTKSKAVRIVCHVSSCLVGVALVLVLMLYVFVTVITSH